MARFVNILLKTIGWLLLVLVLTTVMAVYVVQLPSVQTAIAQKATKWLTDKIGAPVTIGSVRIKWFDNVTLEDVNIKDLKGRNMITVPEVYVDYKTNFTFDFKEKLRFDNNLDYVILNRPQIHMVREPDGYFNTDHWVDKVRSLTQQDDGSNKPETKKPFTIDEGQIQHGRFSMTDSRKSRFPKEEFDYNNFTLEGISGNVKNFSVQGDTITFALKTMKALDKRSGLEVNELSTNFFYSRKQMLLKQLNADINNSQIRNFLGFYYDSPKDFSDFNAKVTMRGSFIQCSIDAQDLARFAPEMYAYREKYRLNGELEGTVENFAVNNLRLDFGQNSFIKGQAAFRGLPKLTTTNWKFDLQPSVLTAEDARQYAGEKYYTNYVQKFGRVDFSGKFDGLYNDFTTVATIKSSGLGEARGNVKVKLSDNPALSTYYGDIVTTKLQLGKLIDRPELIRDVTFDGLIDGKGLTIPSATLKLDGDIRQIYFNEYNYRNIALRGQMTKSVFDGAIEIYDPNLQADVSGTVDFSEDKNRFDLIGNIRNSNLKPLGLTKENLTIRGDVRLDVSGNTLDSWLGEAVLTNIFLKNDQRTFNVDAINLYSTARRDVRKLAVVSDLFDASVSGNFTPSEVVADLKKLVNEYRLFFTADEPERNAYYAATPVAFFSNNYEVDYDVKFRNAEPFFAYFLPEVSVAPGSSFSGRFSQKNTSELSLAGQMDSLRIGKNNFYGNTINFLTSKTAATPDVRAGWNIQSKTQRLGNLLTENFNTNGEWDNANLITIDTEIEQQDNSNKLALFSKLQILPQGFELTIDPVKSYFNILDDRWQLDQNNRIFVQGQDVLFTNVALSFDKQRIALNGILSNSPDEVATAVINNFDLKTLQPLSNYAISGIMSGSVALQDVYKEAFLTSDITIKNFGYENQLVGDVIAVTEWDNNLRKLQVKTGVLQDENEIFAVKGTYDPADEKSPLNLTASFQATPIRLFQGFVKDVFSDLDGNATGDVQVTGMPLAPDLNGDIDIENGQLRIAVLNSFLYFSDKIQVKNSSFTAPAEGITLKDGLQNGNTAILKGGVYSTGKGKYRLGVSATMPGSNGFQLLNTTLADNDSFFGKAFVGGDIQLNGDFNDIVITANLNSKRNTHLVIPLDGATTVNTEVEAIPFFNSKNEIVYDLSTNPADSVSVVPKLNLNGVRMAFNIVLTPAAECEIIFDRTNNDKLVARGNGRLSVDYDTRGGFSINGPFTVESGKYDFSFQNLSSLRKFDIERGSLISWSGDPYTARIDIKTGYIANLSINSIDPSISSPTRYPARVSVNITDDLMHPNIGFGLSFVEQQLPIKFRPQVLAFEDRLRNDQQLMSRNVSSVLAFNQILFGSNEATTNVLNQQFLLENISNLVSNQIGNIASKIDPNFELGLQLGDIRQNFNNTQLNFAYRYSDRLRLKGNSFYSNGSVENITNNQTQLTVGGEIEYILTDDGTWRLRAYSRSVPTSIYSNNLNATTGNVLVSGASVQFSRNFNRIFPQKNFPKGISEAAKKPEEDVSMK